MGRKQILAAMRAGAVLCRRELRNNPDYWLVTPDGKYVTVRRDSARTLWHSGEAEPVSAPAGTQRRRLSDKPTGVLP